MMRRFTVIQGGLSEVSVAGATTARRRDRFAAETVEAAAVGACRSMRVGNLARDPRRGSDHRMPPAQHRPAFRGVGLAVAWSRDAETGQAAERAATAVAETAVARAVDRALRARLAILRGPIRLVGSVEPVRTATPARSVSATGATTRPRAIPAAALVGTRPQGWAPPVSGTRAAKEADGACGAGKPAPGSDPFTAVRSSIAEQSAMPSTGAARNSIVLPGSRRPGLLRRAGAAIARALRLGAAGACLPSRLRS